ncbi:MAG TPA: hypothetical protein VMS17_06125 [Gemmataceae bacterium]|nr:hypothetical protein [Gemmataceae bacterium]
MQRVLGAAVVLILAAGCRKAPAAVDVAGKVDFSVSRPDATLVLSLHPLDDFNKTCTPSAVLETDGQFKLPQCLPGRYKATLAVVQAAGPAGPAGGVNAAPGGPVNAGLPRAYFDATASPWEVTIPEGGKDGLVLTVAPR